MRIENNLMSMPLVSVIIPLYNHENYIEEAISSVLNQTFSDFELIIINDGSNDKSEGIVKRFSDSRIKYIYQSNEGAHNALNKGIDISNGKYISILNSDDVYNKKRLEKFVELVTENPFIDAIFSGIEYIDENSNCLKTTIGAEENWLNHNPENSFKTEENLTLDLLAGNFLKTTSNLFCRADCFKALGTFRNFRYAHDYDFFLKLSYNCNIRIIDDPLVKYRCHAGNTLKESNAAADLECAIVISDFLISHDLKSIFEIQHPDNLIKVFHSINTHHSDRIILLLLLDSLMAQSEKTLTTMLIDNRENKFWEIGYDYLVNFHDGWQARETIFNEWQKLHLLYLKSEEERQIVLQSKGYRLEKMIRNIISKVKIIFLQ